MALALESGMNIIVVHASELRSKVVGDSEKAVARLFAQVSHAHLKHSDPPRQARASAPCMLLLDQLDAVAPPMPADAESSSARSGAHYCAPAYHSGPAC